jgi:mannose-6-phosphate isomerase
LSDTFATRREAAARPWGRYEVLDDSAGHKVKRIVVAPKRRLSLQLHHFRSEHWFIVQGTGVATLGDEERALAAGDSIDVPVRTAHRIANTGDVDLVFIEVQHGESFGEDDIVRLQDDYGRV